MRTIKIKLYKFDELSDKAKENALNKHTFINIEYFDWWDTVYRDAKEVGIKINSFNIDQGAYINGELYEDPSYCANRIIKDHGDICETHKIALRYLTEQASLVRKYSGGENIDYVSYDNEYEYDKKCDELDKAFIHDILQCYLSILREEYEYLTSEEAISEMLIANECEFDEKGNTCTNY